MGEEKETWGGLTLNSVNVYFARAPNIMVIVIEQLYT
jgi:hypothetical protein